MQRFSTLDQWLTWLETLHPNAIDLGLERIKPIAKALQILPLPFPVLTVTGTNGKGSTVAFISSILKAAGYKTACYTSPHLLKFTERLTLNHQPFEDSHWCDALSEVDAARGDTSLTYFEFTTLAALLLLQQTRPDIAILEVGLGGRLDAVNIVSAEIAIITTIAIDHTEWLGPTREDIAREKAGILRPHKPVVCGDPLPPASLIQQAKQLGCPFYGMNTEFSYYVNSSPTNQATSWIWRSPQQTLVNLPLPILPLQNAATSLQVIELLQAHYTIDEEAIHQGLRSAYVPGRFEIIGQAPLRILDVAHNPAAGEWLQTTLQQTPCSGQTLAVVGMLADKDIKNTLQSLISSIDHWYVGGLRCTRGASAEQIAEPLKRLNAKNANSIHLFDTISMAYQQAMASAAVNDRIIVFGSFYTIAEVMNLTAKEREV